MQTGKQPLFLIQQKMDKERSKKQYRRTQKIKFLGYTSFWRGSSYKLDTMVVESLKVDIVAPVLSSLLEKKV
uniref:Uncharacterized protein n=1 Tax=Solanum lycopersicum TaxID=4081 RepID=A0A3Q7HMN6_SOLLC